MTSILYLMTNQILYLVKRLLERYERREALSSVYLYTSIAYVTWVVIALNTNSGRNRCVVIVILLTLLYITCLLLLAYFTVLT